MQLNDELFDLTLETENEDENDGEDMLDFTPTAKTCDIVNKNGKISLFDRERRDFLRLPSGGELVEELHSLEKLCYYEDELLGYKYQVEQGGKWGFISRCFTQYIQPRFDEIIAVKGLFGQMVMAWSKGWGMDEDEEEKINISYSGMMTVKNSDHADLWLPDGPGSAGGIIGDVPQRLHPWGSAYLEDGIGKEGEYKLYMPSSDADEAWLERSNEDDWLPHKWLVRRSKGFLTLEDQATNAKTQYPAVELGVERCSQALEAGELDFEIKCSLKVLDDGWDSRGLYVIGKEGYYAVAELTLRGEIAVKQLRTPFAFTDIRPVEVTNINMYGMEDCVFVDRFGKQGVFNYARGRYVVPCDYESVEALTSGRFRVRKMGFTGELLHDGRWAEDLRR